ncbi:hypothetical protein H0A36_24925 [Endozoicomonas sp. SM1973]|uniref:Uncharacterized protein n=1 Tax=Spartinivicinus marinus TaxID=2994442 RepID=A0A853IIN3_9GAMM|nr:hypothetical protein [Spartinivicinus marinus]MCX4030314.1 hypothetical protein [Spartinivicinus marinus]NYZ69267.1 hypothetical protein [Spartinivicinus marinus]
MEIAEKIKKLSAHQWGGTRKYQQKNQIKHIEENKSFNEGENKQKVDENKEKERRCPKCNAIWKKKTPTLSQVRSAVKESLLEHTEDVKSISQDSQLGYSGSVATGKVGNPKKIHKGMEPDIRGECGKRYDIDGFLISEIAKDIRPYKGKRWGKNHPDSKELELLVRKTLRLKPALRYMEKGKKGFSIVVYRHEDAHKPVRKGGLIIVS